MPYKIENLRSDEATVLTLRRIGACLIKGMKSNFTIEEEDNLSHRVTVLIPEYENGVISNYTTCKCRLWDELELVKIDQSVDEQKEFSGYVMLHTPTVSICGIEFPQN